MPRPKTPRKTRNAFGGYSVSFAGRQETLEQIFGADDITPAEMTKRLWDYVKKHKLAGR